VEQHVLAGGELGAVSSMQAWKMCRRLPVASSTWVVTWTGSQGRDLGDVADVGLDGEVGAARGDIVGVDADQAQQASEASPKHCR
jgi:hypothetical protein